MAPEFRHPDAVTPVSGAVLFGRAPAASAVADALRGEFGAGVTPQRLDLPGQGGVDAVVVTVDAVTALVAPVDRPTATEAVLRACHPVWWPDGAQAVADHRGHVVVTVLHPRERPEPRAQAIQESTIFAVVATQLAALPGAVAVHAASAGLTVPAGAYARAFTTAVEAREVPTDLWTSVWVVGEPDGTHSAYTLGLDTFGHADLVVDHTRRAPAQLHRFLADTVRYVLTRGATFSPGQTVGTSSFEQRPLRARHSSIHGRVVLEVGDISAPR